jgi:hypothetical protein
VVERRAENAGVGSPILPLGTILFSIRKKGSDPFLIFPSLMYLILLKRWRFATWISPYEVKCRCIEYGYVG